MRWRDPQEGVPQLLARRLRAAPVPDMTPRRRSAMARSTRTSTTASGTPSSGSSRAGHDPAAAQCFCRPSGALAPPTPSKSPLLELAVACRNQNKPRNCVACFRLSPAPCMFHHNGKTTVNTPAPRCSAEKCGRMAALFVYFACPRSDGNGMGLQELLLPGYGGPASVGGRTEVVRRSSPI